MLLELETSIFIKFIHFIFDWFPPDILYKSNDGAAIDKAVYVMHSKYQDVEKIFE